MPELEPPGGSVVELYLPVSKDVPLEDWDQKRIESLSYKAIRILERQHPGQRLNIAVSRVRSPKNFRDEMGLYQGALYGLSPDVKPQSYFAHRSAIRGLYLTGKTTCPGYGVISAGASGILAAKAVIDDSSK